MGSEWESYSLDEIVDIGSSKRVKMSDYVTQGVPFFRSKEVIEKNKGNDVSTELFITEEQFNSIELKYGAPKENDILLTSVGTIGVPYQVKKSDRFYFKDGNLTWFKNFREFVNPRYVYFWLTSSIAKRKIDEVTIGSTQQALTISALKGLEIYLPMVSTQDIIVNHLETITRKIELNRQINQTLEQMAQALFKSWFVDFDPVIDNALDADNPIPDALAERAARRQAARASDDFQPLPDDVRQLFPNEFEESELGWIPKGWECTKLDDLIDIKHGFAFKGEFFSDSETSDVLLTPGNVRIGGGLKPDKYKFYSGPTVNDYVFKAGDMFVNMTDLSKASDTLGYPAVVPDYKGLTFHHNQRLGKVIYSDHACSKREFIYQILCSKSYRDEVLGSSTGTTVKHTSPKKILSHSLACSSLGQIEQIFDSKVSYLMKKLNENESNSRVLIKLRDILLPKLISGELRLDSSEVEKAKSLAEAV